MEIPLLFNYFLTLLPSSGFPGRVRRPADHLLNVLLPPSLHLCAKIWLHHQQALDRAVSVRSLACVLFLLLCCKTLGGFFPHRRVRHCGKHLVQYDNQRWQKYFCLLEWKYKYMCKKYSLVRVEVAIQLLYWSKNKKIQVHFATNKKLWQKNLDCTDQRSCRSIRFIFNSFATLITFQLQHN